MDEKEEEIVVIDEEKEEAPETMSDESVAEAESEIPAVEE